MISRNKHRKESLTLGGCSQQNHEAVVTLQLVKVRPYLDLIFCSALQVCQDDAVVRGGFHILDRPGAAHGAVKNAVALNVARQMGHLEKAKVDLVLLR